MGSEALAKAARRDIRRAFAPEASEEVLKFVDGVRQEIALTKAAQHNINRDLHSELDAALAAASRLDAAQRVFVGMAFFQRLRWLMTGRWL